MPTHSLFSLGCHSRLKSSVNDVAGADESDLPLMVDTALKDSLTPSLIWTENPATGLVQHDKHCNPLLDESEHPTHSHGPQCSMRSKDQQQQGLLGWAGASGSPILTAVGELPCIQCYEQRWRQGIGSAQLLAAAGEKTLTHTSLPSHICILPAALHSRNFCPLA